MAAIAAEAGVALKTVYLGLRDQERPAAGALEPAAARRRGRRAGDDRAWYREVLDEPDPERQLRLNARNSRIVKERVGGAARGDPQRRPARPRHRRRSGAASSPTSTTTSAPIVETLRRKQALRPGPRRRPRDRHPLDAQPPRRVAAARRPARLDARRVRAVVRRHRLRAAAGELRQDGAGRWPARCVVSWVAGGSR